MDLKEYTKLTENTCANLFNRRDNEIHMLLGMSTEIGELQDIYKKNLAYNTPINDINVQEELGDLMFYIASFCRINNYDLEKILEVNIKKLKERYPEEFTEEKARNRNLERERQILEELGYNQENKNENKNN